MSWQLGLNRPHLQVWRRWLWLWGLYVVTLVVVGWGLGPRADEILFVLIVPPLLLAGGWGLLNLIQLRLWTLRPLAQTWAARRWRRLPR